ncbi:MAG TPA: proton-conducting transporter membrane subunit [Bacteroidales bacterium]|jgi:hydrogenase-4 component F|nr:hypothetical protein [Bacteroidales bacterium]HPB25665.1 proton-conducting transporter membrane subunit [Bacteroidales bacterium]HPI30350.1 proton-conducting transporter membrane subunit [Bacteroidales bacterium]HQN16307.1 proton-conducting transporter membrane subunit [Bacteroidales bacterium]HQP16473.1 proton-conducting transporter membrane subunit [Bacteroidales bacterium]
MVLAYFITVIVLALILAFAKNRFAQLLVMTVFSLVQTAFTAYVIFFREVGFSGYFAVDSLCLIFLSLLTVVTITTVIQSFVYLQKRNDTLAHRSYYMASLVFFVASMTGVFLSDHIGLMWVFAEATTLSIALLIYHERTPEAIEATWKYIFISTLGLSFSFIGILLLDLSLGGSVAEVFTFSGLSQALAAVPDKIMLQLAFILIVIGFSVKMGVFPLHTVCIDAHSVAPSPVSAMVSTSLMNVGFVAVFRFYMLLSGSSIVTWMNHVLMILGFLTVLVAAIYLVKVKNFKRLIAYSSIENMGLVAIAIAAGGIAWTAAILHLVIHTFVKSGIFYQMAQIIRVFKTKKVYLMGRYLDINPIGGIVMILAFIILSGIPPSGLFFTEFMIFSSLFSGGYAFVAVPVMLLLCFIIYTLAKYFFKTLFGPLEPETFEQAEKICKWESVPQLILLILTLAISIYPPAGLLGLIGDSLAFLPK